MTKTTRMWGVAIFIIVDIAIMIAHINILLSGPSNPDKVEYLIYGMSACAVIFFYFQINSLIRILWKFLKSRNARRAFFKACDNDLGIQIESFREYENFKDTLLNMDNANVKLYMDPQDEWPKQDSLYEPTTPPVLPNAGVYFKQQEDKIEFLMHLS